MSSTFYAAPTYMSGGAFTIYSGARRQKGGGFLGSLRKVISPVGRNMVKGLKTIARNKTVRDIAKVAARKGAEVLTNVAVDALQGQHIGQSLGRRTKQAALETLTGNASNEPAPKRRKVTVKSSYINTSQKLKQKKRIGRKKQLTRGKKRLSRAELNRKQLF